jgi:site-specific DNA recombinase
LRSLLSASDIVQSKAFLRSFVEKIVIEGSKCLVYYILPVPTTWQKSEELVLPIEPFGGAEGVRTPYLLRAREAFSQLNYGPIS